MINAIAPEPLAYSSNDAGHRPRLPMAERTIVPEGAKPTPSDAEVGQESLPQSQDSAASTDSDRKPSTIFAAAVLSGSLAPSPESLTELFMRIGASAIPPESEARLKDLMV